MLPMGQKESQKAKSKNVYSSQERDEEGAIYIREMVIERQDKDSSDKLKLREVQWSIR